MSATGSFLTFLVEERRYALNVALVERVAPAGEVASLPDAHAFVRGLINVAGNILPVIDIRPLTGLVPREMELTDRFIVIRVRGKLLVLLVDLVEGVAALSAHPVTPALSPEGAGEGGAWTTEAAALLGDEIVLIQDMDALALAMTSSLATAPLTGDHHA